MLVSNTFGRLSHHVKRLIFQYLEPVDVLPCIFSFKLFSKEACLYLSEMRKVSKELLHNVTDETLINFLQNKRGPLESLEVNCLCLTKNYKKWVKHLPRTLLNLKLRSPSAPLIDQCFYQILSERCPNLESFSLKEFSGFEIVPSDCEMNWKKTKESLEKLPRLRKITYIWDKTQSFTDALSSQKYVLSTLKAILLSNIPLEKLVVCSPGVKLATFIVTNPARRSLKELKVYNADYFKNGFDWIMGNFYDCVFLLVRNIYNSLEKLTVIDNAKSNRTIFIPIGAFQSAQLYFKNLKCLRIDSYGAPNEIPANIVMSLGLYCNKLLKFSMASCRGLTSSSLSEVLRSNPDIIDLNIDFTTVDDLGISLINQATSKLRKFSAQQCNRITSSGFQSLIEYQTNLVKLNVRSNRNFDKYCIKSMIENLDEKEFYSVKFHGNPLANKAISQLLQKFKKLRKLELSKMDSYPKFGHLLFEKMKEPLLFLHRLDICINETFDERTLEKAIVFFPYLKKLNMKYLNPKLETINVLSVLSKSRDNRITHSLQTINIKNSNPLRYEGLDLLVTELLSFKRLKKIKLSLHNSDYLKWEEYFKKAMSRRKRKIFISSDEIEGPLILE
jgi:hypothetical protein